MRTHAAQNENWIWIILWRPRVKWLGGKGNSQHTGLPRGKHTHTHTLFLCARQLLNFVWKCEKCTRKRGRPRSAGIGVDLFCFHYCATSGTHNKVPAFLLAFPFFVDVVMRKNPVQLIYIRNMIITRVQLHTYGFEFICLDFITNSACQGPRYRQYSRLPDHTSVAVDRLMPIHTCNETKKKNG